MEIVIAGICSAITVAAGVLAFALIPKYECTVQDKEMEKSENDLPEQKASLPATISCTIKSLSRWQWVLISVAAALIGMAAYRVLSAGLQLPTAARLLVTLVLLFPAMIIDLKTHKIPNPLVLLMLALGGGILGLEYILYRQVFETQWLVSAGGLLGCLVLFYLLARLTKNGIGMGDVKLLAAIGWMIGFTQTLAATICSLLACTLVALVLLLTKRGKASDQIPFGPFLFFGHMVIVFLFSL